jgi:hypothetical protein
MLFKKASGTPGAFLFGIPGIQSYSNTGIQKWVSWIPGLQDSKIPEF